MYQALYRKYRPLLFSDVVGQKSIVKVLQNSIIHQHIGHAYMFFGSRGTGKTSLAKIFARTINCEKLEDGEICQKCNSCQEMLSNNCVDIIEIDAASNNGVDEIRELKSKINLVPNQLKYKVYIIDEVHMLSIGAFNALLKTLEEPPEHIVFILATTDPQKVPETIKSRCQCFNFKRISTPEIVEKLDKICNLEKVEVEKEVLESIAISSNGGLRDSISNLDMLVSACNKKITMNDYIEMNDLINDKELESLLSEILNCEIDSFIKHIEKINSSGKNMIQIFDMLLQKGKNYIIDYYQKKKQLKFSLNLLEKLVFLLNEKNYDIRKVSNPTIYMEIIILKFMNECENDKNDDKIISREIIIEQKFDKNTKLDNKKEILNSLQDYSKETDSKKEKLDENISYDKIDNEFLEKYRNIMNIRTNNTLCKADKKILNDVKEKFNLLSEYVFDQKIGYLVCELMDGTVRAASDENILISLEYDSMIDNVVQNIEKLTETLKKITSLNQNLAFITDSEWKNKKQEYILKIKNGENYQYQEEPEIPIIKKQENKKNNEMIDNAQKLFGDIVEEE